MFAPPISAFGAAELSLPRAGSWASSDTGIAGCVPLPYMERSGSEMSCAGSADGLPLGQPMLRSRGENKRVCDADLAGGPAKRCKEDLLDGIADVLFQDAGLQLPCDGGACVAGAYDHQPAAPVSDEAGSCFTDYSCSSGSEAASFFDLPGLLAEFGGAEYGLLPFDPAAPPAPPLPAADPVFDGDVELREVIRNLQRSEGSHAPSADYLQRHDRRTQPEAFIEAPMRRIAVSWLVEVAAEFRLHQDTLFLSIALLDRFLSAAVAPVPRSRLQLIAVACMFLATKHEEEFHPSVTAFTHVADNSFLPCDLLRMESAVLDVLQFRLHCPTPLTFLSLFKRGLAIPSGPLDAHLEQFAQYLLELSLLEYESLRFAPSRLAAAALLLAGRSAGPHAPFGADALAELAGCKAADLADAAAHLQGVHAAACACHDAGDPVAAVKDKYRDDARLRVCELPPL